MSMNITIKQGAVSKVIRNVDSVEFPVICFTCGESGKALERTIESHQGLECPNCHNSMYIALHDYHAPVDA